MKSWSGRPRRPDFPDVMIGAQDVRNTNKSHGNEQNAPQSVQGVLYFMYIPGKSDSFYIHFWLAGWAAGQPGGGGVPPKTKQTDLTDLSMKMGKIF